jgi:hypothetical protein
MKKYLTKLEEGSGFFGVKIEWDVIRPAQIIAFSAGRRIGLQIADAVASSFFYAVEPSQHGFTEDRYARMLKPVVYRHRGRSVGNGIKFFPREVDQAIDTDENLRWVRTDFK